MVMSNAFDVPAIAVDTHVERISKRLGLAKVQDSVEVVEQEAESVSVKRERWNRTSSVYLLRTIFLYGTKSEMRGMSV